MVKRVMTRGGSARKMGAKLARGEDPRRIGAQQRQAVIAELSQRVLTAIDPSPLLDDVVTIVAKTLDVEYSMILELLPGRDALLLRAGAGWREGSVGHATLTTKVDSYATYILRSSEPVIVKDLRTETRFRTPPLLRDHGVMSGVCVTIRRHDRPFGVLGAYTTRRRTFHRDDVRFLQTVANMVAEAIIEEALREREELYRRLIETSPDAVTLTDLGANIMMVSQQAVALYGCDGPEDMIGRSAFDFIAEEDRPRAVENTRKTLQTGAVRSIEYTLVRKDGTSFPAELSASLVTDVEGKPKAFIGVVKDITERKQAEEALYASEERYRSLFEQSPVSLWEEDASAVKAYIDNLRRSGIKDFRRYFEDHQEAVHECAAMVKVVNVSEGTLDLYGIDDKERLREGLAIFLGEESYDVFREELIAIAEGKTWYESEAINRTLAGDKIHIRLKLTVPPGYEETLSKVLISVIDITKRDQAEEALWESGERLRHAATAAFERTVALEGAEPQGTVASVIRISQHGVPLTPRQNEVLGHIVDGRTNEEIAETLVVSRRTVERHVAAILQKLGTGNRAGAAALAVAAGLARPKGRLP
jgi:PAS domain S-box-containing protein